MVFLSYNVIFLNAVATSFSNFVTDYISFLIESLLSGNLEGAALPVIFILSPMMIFSLVFFPVYIKEYMEKCI